MVATTFTLYPEKLPHNGILQDWFMLSWAWKDEGSKTTKAKSVLDFKRKSLSDDYGLVKSIREELDDVDVLIGHNSKEFDIKKLNARLIYHGLPPLPPIHMVDTLKEVKKVAKFTSNRLDYLAKHLTGDKKMETSPDLWMKAMTGDKKAIAEMVKYNKKDVDVLEGVYNKLKPYIKPSVHMGALLGKDKNHTCPKCGHDEFVASSVKTRYSAAGVPREQKQCAKCHGYSTFILTKYGSK